MKKLEGVLEMGINFLPAFIQVNTIQQVVPQREIIRYLNESIGVTNCHVN